MTPQREIAYHQEPLYYGYRSGYADVTKCGDCGRISLREDAHPANPCWQCGGIVYDYGSGKWQKTIKRWSWKLFWFETIMRGYWMDKEGKRIV